MKRLVVKFGGTSVGNLERVRKNAAAIAREIKKGNQVAVVVSAMGHTTDSLIAAYKSFETPSKKEMDFVMALGERASARVFAKALRELKVKARAIDPRDREWPVITDSTHGMANVDFSKTKKRVQRYILPLMKKKEVPVICGFLGRDRKGNITTLGRGGSDITGFLIGACTGADEVIIVTDVDGVMSADPGIVRDARTLKKISVEEMRDLARFGAQVMHPRAMSYKPAKIKAKVVNFKRWNVSAPGTEIIGPRGKEFSGVRLHPEPLAMLTVVGEEMQTTPGILVKTSAPVSQAGVNIFGVSIGPRSFSLYVRERDTERAIKLIHGVIGKSGLMKSVTAQKGLAMITAESGKFIYTPGVITKLTSPVGAAGINIVEILSSRASISFFVDWENRHKALKLFKVAMQKI